ncbi:ribonuclease H2 subunit B isoform X2 [Leguminivora glycinivorella]|uniref:ribonuclease H2 subunit B isoform X2 n=1 Tax=Leguminivora glycinivorella TaxID=1035111 RepID=UPI0020103B6C|nr:ribonuclease H2 subunit B isoform X2 [Leguminivora glycinivorella]
MTRSHKKNNTSSTTDESNKETAKKRVDNSWLLLAPASRKPSKYCLDETNKKIYEVVTFNEPHRCWFTGQTVKSDASMFMLTPINPIFLVLPHVREQCQSKAIPIEDLLSEKGLSKLFAFIAGIDNIADLKGPEDLQAYKYNESKTLSWLESKVKKLAKVLRAKKIHVRSGAASATFVASTANDDTVDDDFFLKYALGIIGEYLEEDIVDILEKKFDFKPDMIESLGQKRKSEVAESNNKRVKSENTEDSKLMTALSPLPNNVTKQKPLTAKEKARQKAASGTKTISAFFTKK